MNTLSYSDFGSNLAKFNADVQEARFSLGFLYFRFLEDGSYRVNSYENDLSTQ
jgi:hypothetical protein